LFTFFVSKRERQEALAEVERSQDALSKEEEEDIRQLFLLERMAGFTIVSWSMTLADAWLDLPL